MAAEEGKGEAEGEAEAEDFIDRALTLYAPIAFLCLVALAVTAVYFYGFQQAATDVFDAVESRKEEKVTQALIINGLLLLWVVFCLPGGLLFIILDGFFFGLLRGFALAFTAELLGALISLAIARSCLKARVRALLLRSATSREVVAICEEDDTPKFPVLIRLLFIPVWVKNYGLAILDITVCVFVLAFVPAELLYGGLFTYFGSKAYSVAGRLRKGDVGSVYGIFSGVEVAIVGLSVCLVVAIACLGWREFRRRQATVEERTALVGQGSPP